MLSCLKRFFLIRKVKSLPFKNLTVYDEYNKPIKTSLNPSPIILYIKDKEFYNLVADKGELGFGLAYSQKYWETNDLPGLCFLLSSHMDYFSKELNSHYKPRKKQMKKKTTETDKQYIIAHYDIGNDFYSKFLDPTFMSYAVGFFVNGNETPEEAIKNSLDYIIEKIQIGAGDKVLDIGSGWGRKSQYIKETSGCESLLGITASPKQVEFCQSIVGNGLNFFEIDYRNHIKPEYYDKIISIEMIEHVGKNNYVTYFDTICKNLKVGGKALVLTSVSTYEKDHVEVDAQNQFILNEVYPGGQIPKISWIMGALNDVPDLRLTSVKMFDGKQYGIMFRYWLSNFHNSDLKDTIPNELYRKFEYYMASCIGLFEANKLATAVFVMEKVPLPE
jgi:cyclopropane-fatty-acyl-phospholipid synthase